MTGVIAPPFFFVPVQLERTDMAKKTVKKAAAKTPATKTVRKGCKTC